MARHAGRGFFRGALEALIEARARQADNHVSRALLMLDDDTLRANGFNREDLKKRSGIRQF